MERARSVAKTARGRRGRGVSLALLLLATANLHAQKAPPGTVVEGDRGVQLDALVTSKAPGFWGAVLVAVDGQPVLAKGYGMVDRAKVPLGPQSLFDLGSAAQQLTAIAMLRLVADGKLRLDDSVGKHLPDWPADKAAITVDHLLQHTAGFPLEASWVGATAANTRNALQKVAHTPLLDRPGNAVHYSRLHPTLLALLAEQILQQRFDRLLVERVCKPLGMSTAGPCNGRFDARLVTSRRSPADERGAPATAWELNWAHRGGCGVLASVLDVHAHLATLTGGKFLDEAGLLLLWRPLEGHGYGVSALPGNGETFVRVHGQTDGYRARWIVQRSRRSWVVILTEDYRDPGPLETALVAAAFAPPAVPAATTSGATAPGSPAAPVGAWPAAELERMQGTFLLPRGGGTFTIAREGDVVWLSGAGLQASARIDRGAWPGNGEERLRRAEDRGLRILELLLADDAAVDRAGFAEATLGSAARRHVLEWRRQHGPVAAIELIGTRLDPPLQPPGSAESWFRLRGKDQDLVLLAPWADATHFRRCEPTTDLPPFRVPLLHARADVAFAEPVGRGRLVVTIEGEGAARRLVFEDDSDGSQGLIECPLLVR